MISRSKATVKIVLAHRSKKSKTDGTQAIQLRLTYNRKPKYYGLGYSVLEEDFMRMNNGNVRGELRDLKIKLQEIESKANSILGELEPFSFHQFETRFFRPRGTRNNAIVYLQKEVKQAREEGRISSMNMVKCALNSVSNYSKNGYLSFDDITVEWLNSYQRNMIDKGNSKSTVGMYLRCVRVVFNKAIKDGVITIDQYPFGKGKYEIPAGRNIKKALKAEDLKKIKEYKPVPDSMEEWARDMWYFIFLCNGINPKDMAKLKYKHIDADQITFVRSKTKDTSKLQMPIVIANSERIQNIIAKWGNPDTNAENYVFPILRPGLSPEQIHSRVHDFFSKVNKGMKAIAASLNITDKVTTYVARHSYATVLKHNGISVDYISESMGHSNIRTTERYLASFDLETRRECSRILLDL
jgi:integrase